MGKIKILVTGGAGLLGSEIVKMFSSSGFEIIAFDLPNAHWETLRGIEGVRINLGDVTDPKPTFEACQDVDAIIHLAAILPPISEVDRQSTMRVNIDGTKIILEALKEKHNVPLVFASSISTYGITPSEKLPIREDQIQHPHNLYAESKIEAERYIQSSGVPYVIFRIAPIAVADLIELPDVIPFKADQRVEFIYVGDAARAVFKAAINPDALGKTLNIAGGTSWQMIGTEYIEQFYGALGVEVDPFFSKKFTALDWYDTSKSRFLDYQRTTFNEFLERLRVLGEQLGLR